MTSLMYEEACAAKDAVAAQASHTNVSLALFAHKLAAAPPNVILTVARGSSNHAASYLAYLFMQRLGIPVTSLPASIITLHHAPLKVRNQVAVAFSQSGQSPDLVGSMQRLSELGAKTVALINAPDSPLERVCEHTISLCAGEEKSVAATKSYIASLSATARFVAHWQNDRTLLSALEKLPAQLEEATRQDWSSAIPVFKDAKRAIVIGRGLGFAIAQEAALKLKETCVIQAEAFSSAEVKHGPMALIDQHYPLFIFAPKSPEQAGLIALAEEMRARDAKVLLAAPSDIPKRNLTLATSNNAVLDPILAIQSFYLLAEATSRARGLDPDKPRFLAKVTRTH